MGSVGLRVNGREYGGWKTARVTRSIEAVAGSFDLAVSERWNGATDPWAIEEEDVCALYLDGALVLSGYVDKRSISYGAGEHSLSVSGRDKAGALVDCSAVLDKAEFRNVPVLTLATEVAKRYGVGVTLQAGLIPPKPPAKLTIDPGESAHDVIEKACRLAGMLPVSDGHGGIVLTRAGSARATTALVEGENILSASVDYDATGRFGTYIVRGQHQGSDQFFGSEAATVKATAHDPNVLRTERTLIVRPEGNVTVEHAKKRAQWEATVRAARAASVSVTVQGWAQNGGSLWPINAFVPLRSPFLGVDGDMLIVEATYSLDDSGGTTTQLKLKRPDAFKPEPTVQKDGLWKEISHGV